MIDHTLASTPPETWGNTILYRLAQALGHAPAEPNFAPIAVDPDELLEEALEIIWRYQDMADS